MVYCSVFICPDVTKKRSDGSRRAVSIAQFRKISIVKPWLFTIVVPLAVIEEMYINLTMKVLQVADIHIGSIKGTVDPNTGRYSNRGYFEWVLPLKKTFWTPCVFCGKS